jgi:hypothetical protein
LVREKITNLLDWYFQATGSVLPESWSFWGFCNQLLDFECITKLQTNWFQGGVFWYGEGSTFWEKEAVNILHSHMMGTFSLGVLVQ